MPPPSLTTDGVAIFWMVTVKAYSASPAPLLELYVELAVNDLAELRGTNDAAPFVDEQLTHTEFVAWMRI
jgi:hypothetical protein